MSLSFSLPRSMCCSDVIVAYTEFCLHFGRSNLYRVYFVFVVTFSAVHFTVCFENADNTTLFLVFQ